MPRLKYSPYLPLVLSFAISKKLEPEYSPRGDRATIHTTPPWREKKKVEKLREQNLFHEEVECVADFVDYGEREHWSAVRSGIKEIEEI